jgi:DNA replication ATP-dependent helicase Dna2
LAVDSLLLDLQQMLEDSVRREASACRAWFERYWSGSVGERVEQGRCIAGLEFHGIESDGTIRLNCREENRSDFREGDLVRLSRTDPQLPLLSKANLFRVEDDAVWVQPSGGFKHAELETGHWVLDPCYIDLESFYRDAILDAGRTLRGRERILPLLGGSLDPGLDLNEFSDAAYRADAAGADESQSEAIASAVATDLCHLVQGPPGTGKTYALAQIVAQRFERGERILVSGLTHRAIHNALNMIRRAAPGIEAIAKIGRPIHDPELQVSQYATFAQSALVETEGGYIVGATPFALRSAALRGVAFDTIIVDEASQMTLPLAVMAMLAGDCYLFIGDEKQLPPVLMSVTHEEAAERSVFAHLKGRGFSTMLETTYRMNEELTRWPSEAFYSGRLQASRSNSTRRLALPVKPSNHAEILDSSQPLVFVELDHASCRNYCIAEATLAADLVETIGLAGLPLADIAVLAPFRRQARLIRSFLARKPHLREMKIRECVTDTVDRLQGQEREAVIVSMTASAPDYLRALAKFILRPQRLNVAVTRARSKVIVLASEQIAALGTHDPHDEELVDIWRSLRNEATVLRR